MYPTKSTHRSSAVHPLPKAAVHEYDTTCACSFASGWRENLKRERGLI